MCLYPKVHKNRKFTPNSKNGGVVVFPMDSRLMGVNGSCGKCRICLKKKANEWKVRLTEEIKSCGNAKFVTFSFSDESLYDLENFVSKDLSGYEVENAIATIAIDRFSDRWRKSNDGFFVRRWLVTELGQNNTERLHIHGILFTDKSDDYIERIWKYGNVFIGKYVNERSINYMVKYLSKSDSKHKHYVPRVFASRGMGAGYLSEYNKHRHRFRGDKTIQYYQFRNGGRVALPSYYRKKLWNDEEREKLWILSLDKQVTYLNGLKIDRSKGDKAYKLALKQAQKENIELGFNTAKVDLKSKWRERKERDERRKKRAQKIWKKRNK